MVFHEHYIIVCQCASDQAGRFTKCTEEPKVLPFSKSFAVFNGKETRKDHLVLTPAKGVVKIVHKSWLSGF